MPRDGSLTLSDVEAPFLNVVCESCDGEAATPSRA